VIKLLWLKLLLNLQNYLSHRHFFLWDQANNWNFKDLVFAFPSLFQLFVIRLIEISKAKISSNFYPKYAN